MIADLRAKVGQTGTSFALVAPPPVLPDEPLLPEPSEAEMVEQLMTAAQLAQTPAERTSLLQTLLGLLDRAVGILPKAWAGLCPRRSDREARGGTESRSRVCRAAHHDADVRREERRPRRCAGARTAARRGARGRHAGWAASRPADIAGLMAALDAQLEAARSMQLARDQWELRAPAARKYRRSVTLTLRAINRNTPALQDVRAQAGPPALEAAVRCSIAGAVTARGWTASRRPRTCVPVHALFRSAWEMGEQAFSLRLSAAASNDPARAQQASSAAAGALMLLTRARADLDAALARPALAAPTP